jgi:hypothetical protein
MKIFYAASTRGFYRTGDKMPDDSVEVEPERFESLMLQQEQGMIIAPGDDGSPVAIENVKDPIEAATELKQNLLRLASETIAPLKDALDGGYIDDADIPLLSAWQKYRYALTKVDPSQPVWPERPAS